MISQPTLFDIPARHSDICRNKHRGNAQSEAANERAPKKRERDHIVAYLRINGPRTCEALSLAMSLPYTAVSARLSELKRDGLVEPTGKTEITSHGRAAQIVRAK
jgi:predicted ArsR family transcriptional regulator